MKPKPLSSFQVLTVPLFDMGPTPRSPPATQPTARGRQRKVRPFLKGPGLHHRAGVGAGEEGGSFELHGAGGVSH